MEEKGEPKSHSLKILEKINEIRNKSEEGRLYLVREQYNGKLSAEFLKSILPVFFDLKYVDLKRVKKDLVTLQTVKRLLPFLFEKECNLEILCKQVEDNMKDSAASNRVSEKP